MKSKYTRYTDFLKDNQFIRWQLISDELLDNYWNDFFEKHPELTVEMQHAVTYLKKEGLNKSNLSETERIQLFNEIQITLQHKKVVKNRKLIWFSAAAIAVIVIGITFFTSLWEHPISISDREQIVGEMLHSKDILLITSGESISFQQDIEIWMNHEGEAEIKQYNREESQTFNINQEKLNSLVIPYGKRTTLTLADGSKVWLNSGSVIEFPAQFTGKNREIRLASGEMYIEVTPDKKRPFYVHTAEFKVKVYGTAFNLSAYENNPSSVVLVKGSVALQKSGETKEVKLLPSEKGVYDSQTGIFSTQSVDINKYISWKEGYLNFDKTPMLQVLQQIGRYYNLSFNYENDVNLKMRTCTGKIYLSDNLDNVMETIAILTSTKYNKMNNQIFITNSPR